MSRTKFVALTGSLSVSVAALVMLLVLLSTFGDSGLPVVQAAPSVSVAQGVTINEVRIDQPGGDDDEYFELAGAAGTSLDGLTYLVIGDGTGGSGVIEAVVELTGTTISSDGLFLVAEDNDTFGSVADLTATLNFENNDNVTHLLVGGFTGSDGDDLDTNDDGTLDITPWTEVLDLIALIEEENPPAGTEYHYGPPTVGPDGSYVPGHVYRCSAGWIIGQFNPAGGDDTPGAANNCLADVTVTKTGPALASAGSVITYTLACSNDGVENATAVIVSDTLPGGVSYLRDNSGLSCPSCSVGATDILTWYVGAVTATDSFSFTLAAWITSSLPFGSAITNTVVITTADAEVTTTNNSDQWVTNISPLDLVVAKAGPEYAVFGENVIYTITLSNIGVTTATNVILTDTLPISTTYVSDSSGVTPTRPTSTTVVWNFGDVPSDTVRAFNLTVKIAEPPPGTLFLPLLNRVEISTDTPGDDPSNNTAASIGTAYPLVSIHDIQYVTGPASNDVSPYDGWFVWVEGVVVAGTGEIGSGSNNFVIEHPDGGPWSGLLVYNGGTFTDVVEGDYVRLLGQVDEYYGMTEIMIRYAPHVQRVISTGNALPTPEFITTGLFATAVPTTAEAYESVLIEFQGATVTALHSYGEWSLDDGTGATRADDFGGSDGDLTYTPELGDVYDFIRGIGWYSYGDYKLEPRYDADIFMAPKLSVNKTVYPMADVELGSVVVYTVTVANRGDREATGVVITDPLPSAITFGGYVSNPGGTAQLPDPTGVITWMYPVAAGAGYTFVFTATVTTDTAYYGADVTNSVYFTSDNANNGAGSAVFAIRDLNHIYLPLILRNSGG